MFWYDNWIGDDKLKDLFPRVFVLDRCNLTMVADRRAMKGSNGNGVEKCGAKRNLKIYPNYLGNWGAST